MFVYQVPPFAYLLIYSAKSLCNECNPVNDCLSYFYSPVRVLVMLRLERDSRLRLKKKKKKKKMRSLSSMSL